MMKCQSEDCDCNSSLTNETNGNLQKSEMESFNSGGHLQQRQPTLFSSRMLDHLYVLRVFFRKMFSSPLPLSVLKISFLLLSMIFSRMLEIFSSLCVWSSLLLWPQTSLLFFSPHALNPSRILPKPTCYLLPILLSQSVVPLISPVDSTNMEKPLTSPERARNLLCRSSMIRTNLAFIPSLYTSTIFFSPTKTSFGKFQLPFQITMQ